MAGNAAATWAVRKAGGWLVLFLSVSLSGCCSGVAGFVKYTDDGRHVIAQDAMYMRSYLCDVATGRTQVFDGYFGTEDPHGRRWIVHPAPLSAQILYLVEIENDGRTVVTRLPPVPGMKAEHAVKTAFGPDSSLSVWTGWEAMSWSPGDTSWRRITDEHEKARIREQVSWRPENPVGTSEAVAASPWTWAPGASAGHARCTRHTEFGPARSDDFELDSPDGLTMVEIRVSSPGVLWALGDGSVVLVVKNDGRRVPVMLSNNHLHRLVQNYLYGPIATAVILPFARF